MHICSLRIRDVMYVDQYSSFMFIPLDFNLTSHLVHQRHLGWQAIVRGHRASVRHFGQQTGVQNLPEKHGPQLLIPKNHQLNAAQLLFFAVHQLFFAAADWIFPL